jgi:hypothetical protein
MSHRALAIVALLASTAHADDARWDATYAFGANLQTIGGDFYTGMLLQFQLGRRITQRIAVSASAELASALRDSGDTQIQGAIVRGLAGVDLYLLAAKGMFQPALVATIGCGSETVAWDRGTLTRPTSYVGAEYRGSFALGDSGMIRNLSRIGFRFGVRGQVSPGVAETTIAKLCTACEGMDAPKRGVELGVAIYMGLIFGR